MATRFAIPPRGPARGDRRGALGRAEQHYPAKWHGEGLSERVDLAGEGALVEKIRINSLGSGSVGISVIGLGGVVRDNQVLTQNVDILISGDVSRALNNEVLQFYVAGIQVGAGFGVVVEGNRVSTQNQTGVYGIYLTGGNNSLAVNNRVILGFGPALLANSNVLDVSARDNILVVSPTLDCLTGMTDLDNNACTS